LEHPNIIWLHEIIDDPTKNDIYLVTQYHSRGSIGDLVKEKNKMFLEKTCKGSLNESATDEHISKEITVGLYH